MSRPDLVRDVHRHWLTKQQVGCVFAQALNTHSDDQGLSAVVVQGGNGSDVAQLSDEISRRAFDAHRSLETEAISILIPGVTDLNILCSLLRMLGQMAGWKLRPETDYVDPLGLGHYALVGLDFLQEDSTPSAVLGLGPRSSICPSRAVDPSQALSFGLSQHMPNQFVNVPACLWCHTWRKSLWMAESPKRRTTCGKKPMD